MSNRLELKKTLHEHIRQLKCDPLYEAQFGDEEALCERLIEYLMLLDKWNQAYNLTAIRDLEQMILRHLIDSLAISPWLHGERFIDIGSGAGLPGIPLALAHPTKCMVLLDSNGKKIRFLQEVKRSLNLTNVEIVHLRVESYYPTKEFDTVISRAFSQLSQMIKWTKHLIAKEGIWLAMKGVCPVEELKHITHSHRVLQYTIAGVEGERCSVIIEN